MTFTEESEIDSQLNALESQIPSSGNDIVARLSQRSRTRRQYENIASRYASLYDAEEGSELLPLKLIASLETMRSPEVGKLFLRLAKLGPLKRRPWPPSVDKPWKVTPERQINIDSKAPKNREFREGVLHNQPLFNAPGYNDEPEIKWATFDTSKALDLDNVLILHLGLIEDSLIVALDTSLPEFIYGSEGWKKKKVLPKAFADYGYKASAFDVANILYGPVIKHGVRLRLFQELELLHSNKWESNQNTDFLYIMRQIDKIFEIDKILYSIKEWIHSKRKKLEDVCVVIAPDEELFQLPLPFLGASLGTPLASELGGVSVVLNLLALKWRIKDYHWATLVNMGSRKPRCTFFAADKLNNLDLNKEKETLESTFGSKSFRAFGDEGSRTDFSQAYSSGDICWFSGHGEREVCELRSSNARIIAPISGPAFSDGVLTNWDLDATSNWNFKSVWLSVFNACVIGLPVMVGPNPLGFVTSMHSAGSVGTISALWDVKEHSAQVFAKHLSRAIKKHYGGRDFPRARAYSDAIRASLAENAEDMWRYAPYTLWGVP